MRIIIPLYNCRFWILFLEFVEFAQSFLFAEYFLFATLLSSLFYDDYVRFVRRRRVASISWQGAVKTLMSDKFWPAAVSDYVACIFCTSNVCILVLFYLYSSDKMEGVRMLSNPVPLLFSFSSVIWKWKVGFYY